MREMVSDLVEENRRGKKNKKKIKMNLNKEMEIQGLTFSIRIKNHISLVYRNPKKTSKNRRLLVNAVQKPANIDRFS